MPSLPPYLGTWEELVNALLHNPFLGSGRGGHPYTTHSEAPELLRMHRPLAASDPMPAHQGAVTSIIGLVSLKEAASTLANSPAKEALVESIDSSLAAEIDDICPPWPWPGPPPWVSAIVATLVFAANTLQDGGVQTELKAVAKQLLQRALDAGKSKSK